MANMVAERGRRGGSAVPLPEDSSESRSGRDRSQRRHRSAPVLGTGGLQPPGMPVSLGPGIQQASGIHMAPPVGAGPFSMDGGSYRAPSNVQPGISPSPPAMAAGMALQQGSAPGFAPFPSRPDPPPGFQVPSGSFNGVSQGLPTQAAPAANAPSGSIAEMMGIIIQQMQHQMQQQEERSRQATERMFQGFMNIAGQNGINPNTSVNLGGSGATQDDRTTRDSAGQNQGNHRVVLEEKHFRRVDKFDGDMAKFRGWVFDLTVAIGQIDKVLCRDLKDVLSVKREEEWDPELEHYNTYEKYHSELYGVIVSLTQGEAKGVVKGIVDRGGNQDGYKALALLAHRYDAHTTANLLRSFMDVASPSAIKGSQGLVKGVHHWEARVGILKSKFGEELSNGIKMAILVGMLPQEYQDMCMQAACTMGKEPKYEALRDHVFNVANQRIQAAHPTPMDVGNVVGDIGGDKMSQDDLDLDAVNRGTKCYNCQGFGHMARECPTPKGKGNFKGSPKGGFKGDSRGSPKGGVKGDTKGYQGYQGKGYQGKGFQGSCWTCGKPGHRADQCKGIQEISEESGENQKEECAVEIGGVWDIACVDHDRITCHNMFQGLSGEAQDEMPELVNASKQSKMQTGNVPDGNRGFRRIPRKAWKKVRFVDDVPSEDNPATATATTTAAAAATTTATASEDNPATATATATAATGGDKSQDDGILSGVGAHFKGMHTCAHHIQDHVCHRDINVVESKQVHLGFNFQVCSVKKALIAVKRICEKGNQVSFGPKEGDNYIQNISTGDKTMLRSNGKGSYLMDVSFPDGRSACITVDSGAEENVCPYEWGSQFGIRDADRWMSFRGADGSPIKHYGQRDIKVISQSF